MTCVWRASARAESRQREGGVAMTRERDNGDPSTFGHRYAMADGSLPTVIGGSAVFVAVWIGVIVPEDELTA